MNKWIREYIETCIKLFGSAGKAFMAYAFLWSFVILITLSFVGIAYMRSVIPSAHTYPFILNLPITILIVFETVSITLGFLCGVFIKRKNHV
jgi:hypothetical protein